MRRSGSRHSSKKSRSSDARQRASRRAICREKDSSMPLVKPSDSGVRGRPVSPRRGDVRTRGSPTDSWPTRQPTAPSRRGAVASSCQGHRPRRASLTETPRKERSTMNPASDSNPDTGGPQRLPVQEAETVLDGGSWDSVVSMIRDPFLTPRTPVATSASRRPRYSRHRAHRHLRGLCPRTR